MPTTHRQPNEVVLEPQHQNNSHSEDVNRLSHVATWPAVIDKQTVSSHDRQSFPSPNTTGNGPCLVGLDEATKSAVVNCKQGPKYGNPAVLGLAGFGLTTMVLQFHNFGWIGTGPVVWLGLVFGGLAQMVAGFQEFCTGNNFGYSAFSTYGAFWMSLALMLIGDHHGIFTISRSDMACFLLAFTFYTLLMWIATFCLNVALFVVFGTLFMGFVCLDIAHFITPLNYDTTPSPRLPTSESVFKIMGGVILVICALGAWYVMAALIYKDTFGRDVLPVGPSPKAFFHRKLYEHKRKRERHNALI